MVKAATTPDERVAKAADVCATYEAGPAALAMSNSDCSPVACIEQLSAAGERLEAIQLMSRWLTKREAIWWGALCIWQSRRPLLPASEEATLQAIVSWVLEPSDEQKQIVRERSRNIKTSQPVTLLALAVFMSEGSISTPGLPVVEPHPDATASVVSKLLRAVALRMPDYSREEAYQQFLRIGLEIVAGDSHWEK